MNADLLGFRRRCTWCGVPLRGWQLNACRLCKRAIVYSPSPPCAHASRWDKDADDTWWTRLAPEVRRMYLILTGLLLVVAGAVLVLIGAFYG